MNGIETTKVYTNWDELPIILTTDQIARLLKITPNTVKVWVRDGKIPSFKLGNARRFRKDEIKKWTEEKGKDI